MCLTNSPIATRGRAIVLFATYSRVCYHVVMVDFTQYATDKFGILRRHGFIVEPESVKQVLELPDTIDESKKPLIAYQRKTDARYSLRVICKKEEGLMRVITFYPVK